MWIPSCRQEVLDYLDDPENNEKDPPSLFSYACALFQRWPTLETFALCDELELSALRMRLPGEPPDPGESIGVCDKAAPVARGFRREGDGVVGPMTMEFAQEGWRHYTPS